MASGIKTIDLIHDLRMPPPGGDSFPRAFAGSVAVSSNH